MNFLEYKIVRWFNLILGILAILVAGIGFGGIIQYGFKDGVLWFGLWIFISTVLGFLGLILIGWGMNE